MIWWQVFVGFVVGLVLFWLSHRRGVHEERRRWIAYPNIMRELYVAEKSFESNAPPPVYHPLQFPFQRYEYGCDPAFTPAGFSDAVLKLVDPPKTVYLTQDIPNGNCSVCGKASYWNERDCEHMKAIAIHPCNKEGRSPEQFAEDMDKLWP